MNVHEGMAKVMAEVSSIAKQRSEGVSYAFRGIDDVMNALHGPMSDAGLFMAPRVLDDWQLVPIPGTNNRTQYQAAFRVAVDVWASDGSKVTLGPGLAQSHDYGDKAVYQAQQNAIKYLLLEAFAIPTSEPDMDARTPDDVPAEKTTAYDKLLEDADHSNFKLWTPEEHQKAWTKAWTSVNPSKPVKPSEAQEILRRLIDDYAAFQSGGELPLGKSK